MKKYIAVVIALVVVLGAFYSKSLLPLGPLSHATSTPLGEMSLNLPSVLSFFHIEDTPVAIEAWDTFEKYIAAAKIHDLPTLSKLSYQLSPTCKSALTDESKLPACYELMDSVAYFAGNFKQADFPHVIYDNRQIVLSTDYMGNGGATKTVIFFVRETGSPKVLGISFCFGGETKDECTNTDPHTRDADHDGWWDDVEALFKK